MPLDRLPAGRLRRVGVPALVLYLLAFLPFMLIGEPAEMVRLQLAGSESRAEEIVAGWSPQEIVDMAYLQGVDAVHPFAYGTLLAVAAIWAGRRMRGRAASWGPAIAWLAVAAGVLDTLENVGMVIMIRGDVAAPVPTITTIFAVAKFILFAVAVPYALAGLATRSRGSQSESTNH